MRKSILLMALAITLLASCAKREDVDVSHEAVFRVRAFDAGPNYAKIEITHNGSNRDTYYGFVVEGRVRDLRASVDSFIKEDETIFDSPYTQKKRVLTLTSLMPERDYSYVVFMFDSLGNVKNNIDSCCFRTVQGVESFTVDTSMVLKYLGETLYNKEYWSKVSCTLSENQKDYVYSCIVSSEEYDKSKTIAELIYSQVSVVSEYLIENDDKTIADIGMVSRVSSVDFYWCQPGDYYALAIAVDDQGQPTGMYSITEKFHIDEYTHVKGFAALLGKWEVKDADGTKFDIEIVSARANRKIEIKKWGGFSFSVSANYDLDNDYAIIKCQKVASDVEFTDGSIGNLVLNIWYETSDGGSFRDIKFGELAVVRGNSSSSTITITPYYKYSDKETSKGLYYEIWYDKGERGTLNKSRFKFPFSITKKT